MMAAFGNADHHLALVVRRQSAESVPVSETAGQFVIHKTGIDLHAEVRIHHTSFEQRHAQRLDHAADLALHGQAIKRQAAVLTCSI